jgi:hypothetical protein
MGQMKKISWSPALKLQLAVPTCPYASFAAIFQHERGCVTVAKGI